MEEFINHEVLATTFLMSMADVRGVMVIVEGNDDRKLYRLVLNSSLVKIFPADNRDKAIEAFNFLRNSPDVSLEKKNGMVVFADADFDFVDGSLVEDVIYTDFHDSEIMLIWSGALDRYLFEYGMPEKVSLFGAGSGAGCVRGFLLSAAEFLGRLRLLSKRLQLGIDFKDIRYENYLDKSTLSFDDAKLCQALYTKNRHKLVGHSMATMQQDSAALHVGSIDGRHIVQGHDSVAMLGILMRAALSSLDSSRCSEAEVSAALRLAYRPSDWRTTSMCRRFELWLESVGKIPSEYVQI